MCRIAYINTMYIYIYMYVVVVENKRITLLNARYRRRCIDDWDTDGRGVECGETKSRSRQCSNSALRDLIKCRRWITTTHMGLAEGEHERYIERDTGIRLQCPCAGEAIWCWTWQGPSSIYIYIDKRQPKVRGFFFNHNPTFNYPARDCFYL